MNAQITFKTGDTLKQEFSDFVSELGMSVSTALNLFMKDCIRNNRMNIDLSVKKKNPREGWREATIKAHRLGEDRMFADNLDDLNGEWQWYEEE